MIWQKFSKAIVNYNALAYENKERAIGPTYCELQDELREAFKLHKVATTIEDVNVGKYIIRLVMNYFLKLLRRLTSGS